MTRAVKTGAEPIKGRLASQAGRRLDYSLDPPRLASMTSGTLR
jgi:hypothetical protein